ncbi:MAG TPA: hypothetical protein VK716_11365 [Terracidiphilus sp.]|jgi:hypothetical protein|nr:hypothetical protein [Terracidiphilus sp.]
MMRGRGSREVSIGGIVVRVVLIGLLMASGSQGFAAKNAATPGARSVMDAHNCYPYGEWWSNRIDRALSAGTPLAIEQDLGWYTDPKTGKSWSVVTHGDPLNGDEPVMEQYFFAKVRPIVEKALAEGNHGDWPLITLNLDFKDNKPEHLAAVRALLLKYRAWISEASKGADANVVEPLTVRPILVLTGESDAQQTVFYDELAIGDPVLAFGAVHSGDKDPEGTPAEIDSEKATNYRRWWNNPWKVVEAAGQPHAGEWTEAKAQRLRALVERAHANGLWIRFYTLDGATEAELSSNGWFHGYNFGSLDAARTRWQAAMDAGVDYIASDQYELLGKEVRERKR